MVRKGYETYAGKNDPARWEFVLTKFTCLLISSNGNKHYTGEFNWLDCSQFYWPVKEDILKIVDSFIEMNKNDLCSVAVIISGKNYSCDLCYVPENYSVEAVLNKLLEFDLDLVGGDPVHCIDGCSVGIPQKEFWGQNLLRISPKDIEYIPEAELILF